MKRTRRNHGTTFKAQVALAAEGFGGAQSPTDTSDPKTLHAKIGQMTLENDFFEGALTKAGSLSVKR